MKISFIGGGNMASAIIGGVLNSGLVSKEDICVSVATEQSVERIKNDFGTAAFCDNKKAAACADFLILAVKPKLFKKVISEIKDSINKKAVIISVAAGIAIENIEDMFGSDSLKIVRAMPNTPALVGKAMSAVCFNKNVSSEENKSVLEIFNSFGIVEIVDESLMGAVTGVSGSSPAYVYIFIEALADAAVREGMLRKQAYTFAAQAVLGSAEMVLKTGIHPAVLKDNVCSPAGTTIRAVAALEENGFRNAVMEAVRKCVNS